MLIKGLALILGLSFFGPSAAEASAWGHRQDRTWNETWEARYSAWVESKVDTDWLRQPGSLFSGWNVDCAKFVYLARLQFSYENNLEFAVVDTKSPSKKISSLDSRWDAVPLGPQRVQVFAESILSQVDTSTLPQDTVLVPLDPQYIKPGLIVSADRLRAHTWMIAKIHASGIPRLIYATLPASAYLYESYVFPAPQAAFPLGKLPSPLSGGLRRFRWPQDLFKKVSDISYASADQFDPQKVSYKTFFDDVQNQIRISPQNSNEEFGYLLDDLCMKVRVRVNVIIDAGQALATKARRDPEAFDNLYSTQERDRDIIHVIAKIDSFFDRFSSQILANNKVRYKNLLAPQWTTEDECLISWASNRIEPLGVIRQRFLQGFISSKATDSFAERWGELKK